jgi:hypothetical protein
MTQFKPPTNSQILKTRCAESAFQVPRAVDSFAVYNPQGFEHTSLAWPLSSIPAVSPLISPNHLCNGISDRFPLNDSTLAKGFALITPASLVFCNATNAGV